MPAAEVFDAVKNRDHARLRDVLSRFPDSVHLRDADGATPLHHAAELGDRDCVALLLDAGADINARDSRFGATPAGWAIEYLRARGALLGIEIEDARLAIVNGDAALVERYLTRFPALRDAVDRDGTPLRTRATDPAMARLFER